jgi:hypothetical protein
MFYQSIPQSVGERMSHISYWLVGQKLVIVLVYVCVELRCSKLGFHVWILQSWNGWSGPGDMFLTCPRPASKEDNICQVRIH